jgi:hypothetical protein
MVDDEKQTSLKCILFEIFSDHNVITTYGQQSVVILPTRSVNKALV